MGTCGGENRGGPEEVVLHSRGVLRSGRSGGSGRYTFRTVKFVTLIGVEGDRKSKRVQES